MPHTPPRPSRTLSPAGRIAALVGLVVLLAGCAADRADEPAAIAEGRALFGRYCSACHGEGGQGGVGPALGEVVATFPDCSDHVMWVRLGSERWIEERGPTYGADDTEVDGGMPPWEGILTDADLTAVAAFERTRFGGVGETTAVEECTRASG